MRTLQLIQQFAGGAAAVSGIISLLLTAQGRQDPLAGAGAAIVPQARNASLNGMPHGLHCASVDAKIKIIERIAETELLIAIQNQSEGTQESIMVVPVPEGATLKSFHYEVAPPDSPGVSVPVLQPPVKPYAQLMRKDEARQVYESIVRVSRDPGLLEFAGYNMIRSNIFPIPPGGTAKLKLQYEHLLDVDDNRVDYYLPRSENLGQTVPWTITIQLQSDRDVQMAYSPTHKLKTTRTGPHTLIIDIDKKEASEPGPFQMSVLYRNSSETGAPVPTATLMTHPDDRGDGGYFLFLASIPKVNDPNVPEQKREVVFVMDRSGSMAGAKMEQARQAALQVLESLKPGEFFNIIDYSSRVEMFSPHPIVKNDQTIAEARAYVKRINSDGGTNINDALFEGLSQPAIAGAFPIMLFLTDGLPTSGVIKEDEIRNNATKANRYHRRIFTFGVGSDVNAPLLDALANGTRALSTYVHPSENVETKVAQVAKRLTTPILSDPLLHIFDADGSVTTRRTRDICPSKLQDLFPGDEIVVLGRYFGDEPIQFRIIGNYNGASKAFDFKLNPKTSQKTHFSTFSHSFIPRLWASRRIGELVDEVRLVSNQPVQNLQKDPRTKEVVDEIITLSTRFGVLSEYTSFFANEPVDLAQRDKLHQRLTKILSDRAGAERTGQGAVAQAINIGRQRGANTVQGTNTYLDGSLKETRLKNIQQKNDRAMFRKGIVWVDSKVFENVSSQTLDAPADITIPFGSEDYFALAHKLGKEGKSSVLSMNGKLLLWLDGKRVLVDGAPAYVPK